MEVTGNSGGHDVGGATGRDTLKVTAHGSTTNDFRLMVDGMPQGALYQGGGDNVGVPPADSLAEELNIQFAALSAEMETGGVHINMVPKSGGNSFQGAIFSNFATGALQANNLTEALKAKGLSSGGNVKHVVDVNPVFGGPIRRDRLWFFGSYRDFRPVRYSTMYPAKDPKSFIYTPDTTQSPVVDDKPQWNVNGRVTWQVSQRNRITAGVEVAAVDMKHSFVGAQLGTILAGEAAADTLIKNRPIAQISWSAPLSNRLLLEAGGQTFRGEWLGTPGANAVSPGATEQSTGIRFRSNIGLGAAGYTRIYWTSNFLRGAVTYTSGAHALKVGATVWPGQLQNNADSQGQGPYSVTLLNGVPRSVAYRMDPLTVESHHLKLGAFAQDQWSLRRLTVNAGLRFDSLNTSYPAQHEVPTAYLPARDFAAGDVLSWRDLSPRLGVAYDLFGNGKTAVKASISRYVLGEAAPGYSLSANPAQASAGGLSRTWTDANGDYVPQGDPTIPAANGELGPSPNAAWGSPVFTTRFDPSWSRGGFGVRPYNWETSATVQHELMSNVSLNVGYFRRIFGNFVVSDNLALTPGDFDPYCVTAPGDSRLPGGGGNQICGLKDVNPAKFGQQNNKVTLASNYGKWYQHYNGVDIAVNARMQGVLLQGGVNVGKGMTDNCDVVSKLPELLVSGTGASVPALSGTAAPITGSVQPTGYCHQDQPWLSQVKLLGSYELPLAVEVSATYQDAPNAGFFYSALVSPPMGLTAGFVAANAAIVPSLGRNLSAGANGTVTVNIVTPGSLYGDRLRQLDFRLSRTFKMGRTSIKGMFDLYNAMNRNTVNAFNTTYGTNGSSWLLPVAILPGRLAKFGFQVNF